MMTCEEFFAEFGDYLENRVSPELRMELEQHRLHCRECDVLYDSTFKAIKIVTESNSFDLPENISGRDYRARYGKVEVRPKVTPSPSSFPDTSLAASRAKNEILMTQSFD